MITAGFGFTSRATADSLRAALVATGHADVVQILATPKDKAAHPAIQELARDTSLGIKAIQPAALQAARTRTQSAISRLTRRTGSVAEATALAAAGPGAELITPRHISDDRMATCAIAKGPDT